MDDTIESLKRQLEIHRRNLRKLEERKALYGPLDVPLKLQNEIELEQKEITRLEENIRIRIEIEVGPKAPDTSKKPRPQKPVRGEVQGRRGCASWWGSLSDGTKAAYIGLIGTVTVAIIGLIGVLGAPVITEFAKSLFAPTATFVAVASTSSPTLTATSTPTATPTNTPTATSTPTVTSTNTPIPTHTPTPDAIVVALVNLRSGPGTEYDVIGTLHPGRILTVTGRIADASWLQVNTDQMQEGWVVNWANLVTLNLPTDRIPIVLTMSPPPQPVPESPPPPPTEDIRFWTDSEHVSAGACTMVHWHVSNVNAYWVDGQPRAGDDGSFQTCPCQDETHTLRVVKRDGSEQNLSVTIRVSEQCIQPPPPHAPGPTPTCLITKPADGDDSLGYGNDVRAKCSDVPDALYVWILVYSHHDYNYYPQPGPIGKGSGQWMGKAWLGWPTDGTGQWFNIIVALANEVVSGRLQQDVESCSKAPENCPGYRLELPGGVEEKARITVKRGHD